jgi:hypothetical protein
MFDSHQKSTGTDYTMTSALLIMAVVLIPAILFLSRPFGYGSVSLALVCSVMCVALARLDWKKYSRLTIPSIETRDPGAK